MSEFSNSFCVIPPINILLYFFRCIWTLFFFTNDIVPYYYFHVITKRFKGLTKSHFILISRKGYKIFTRHFYYIFYMYLSNLGTIITFSPSSLCAMITSVSVGS